MYEGLHIYMRAFIYIEGPSYPRKTSHHAAHLRCMECMYPIEEVKLSNSTNHK